MSSSPHIIRRQLVEVRLPPGADSRAVQERLSHLCREVVAKLLDEHFSRYAGPAPVQLARIELDLGTIALPDLERLLPQRLTDELQRVLPPAVLAAGAAALQTQPARPPGPESDSTAPAPGPAPDLDLIAYFLRSGLLPWWATPVSFQRLAEAFARAQAQDARALKHLLTGVLDETGATERLVHACPDALLEQLLELWLPAAPQPKHLAQLRAALLGPSGDSARSSTATRVAWWHGLYKTAADSGVASGQHAAQIVYQMLARSINARSTDAVVAPLAEQGVLELVAGVFQAKKLGYSPVPASRPALGLPEPATPRTGAIRPGAAAMGENTSQPGTAEPLPQPSASSLAPEEASTPPASRTVPAMVLDSFSDSDKISIQNTGLVLLWPFLPRFFATLGLTSEGRFQNEGTAVRACLLLQYLVDGTADGCFEALLPLNKLLCGIEMTQPLPTDWVISPEESDAATNLLEAVIQNGPLWRTLSIDAFRQAFLRREGLLSTRDGHWVLQAARETHDVIIDRLPWAARHIKLPWMKHLLFTEWQQA